MKKLLYFITIFFASTGFANQLHNYDQIKSAVIEGKLIRIYVDYTKCSSSSKQLTIPNNAAAYTPNAIAMANDGSIGAYVLYFTLKDPQYPSKPVYQYGRYIISNDNSLTLTFSVLNAADYTYLSEHGSSKCKIDDGAKVFTLLAD